mmetsp:Transcript_6021/g.16040  ORF Transcript_6021/g.16040 Transcript_6021/m.16040 type:complete len:273 (-) Transcript_6021:466-1284(-)|eukprot:CAMPEP_0202353532 /NCGR_PEP_ID=MMETSP1126-20121109/9252_1 /ASSEMBLY_ACC=CAM_ASM_000457 /TAXON_ID=3047 /ORGANISM="Dunaliella tertiolecta, Strain CCMP1320" /LENGTH=272 /DNA_ID=CAMNT_0048945893 /DNA_START=71 /DNA_END=889 /DNA_ORIENTATION=-
MTPSITHKDVVLVQSMIERCLQHYMTRADVVQTLHNQAKIEPGFTSLVWQKLEDQNPDFFKAYYLRLKLKDQVIMFNYLVEQQMHMVQKLNSSWVQPLDVSMAPGTQPLQPSVQPTASLMMLPPQAGPYSHPHPHSNAHIPNNNSSSNGNNASSLPKGCGHRGMASMLQPSQDYVAGVQGQHAQHIEGHAHQHHDQQQHNSEPLVNSTPTLQALRCLGGSTDALDALGGMEDLTMGMNPFPSSNDLIDLAGGQMDSHLNLGMGDLGDCELGL